MPQKEAVSEREMEVDRQEQNFLGMFVSANLMA